MDANPLSSPGPDRIVVAGDWDGNTGRACLVIWYAGTRNIPLVLQLGDFGFWTPGEETESYLDAVEASCAEHGVQVICLDGNHEFFPALYALPVSPETGMRPLRPHVHHLPRGLRWRWHGKTWMALGGAHSVDRLQRSEGRSWWKDEHLTQADVERAITPGPVDVIVSHDAPDGVLVPGLRPDQFPASELATAEWHRRQVGTVVYATTPQLLLHGHYHVRYTGRCGTTTVLGLADDSAMLADNIVVLNLVGDLQPTK
ncbi:MULTISPECIES: metallophosphoesterase family protein [Mycolicibacter]|uniref:Metallophosphoesterase n=2 Tax=Mycolicibacter TaxID=1073531 RepID=A0ABU5XM47_9MYCO|nr:MULTISPECIES: metallophosphoesterase [unclassified Mycolicibacter]MEB3023043.1 metallophosphoesterase [Mycolicibacter sp. MYC098]MEB3033553.1 metallophosphoesterase [Mycolicibacter sp. MYC340]